MKCQILFSGKNKKNVINLSSAENAQRVVKVNVNMLLFYVMCVFYVHFHNKHALSLSLSACQSLLSLSYLSDVYTFFFTFFILFLKKSK